MFLNNLSICCRFYFFGVVGGVVHSFFLGDLCGELGSALSGDDNTVEALFLVSFAFGVLIWTTGKHTVVQYRYTCL